MSVEIFTDEQKRKVWKLAAAAPDLLEACITFATWLQREDEGFIKDGKHRDTPEGESEWQAWFDENVRLCDLAKHQAIDAIRKATMYDAPVVEFSSDSFDKFI